MMIGDSMKIFKRLIQWIWSVFDVIMLVFSLITLNLTLFTQVSILAGGISLALSFLVLGIASEFIEEFINKKKGGD